MREFPLRGGRADLSLYLVWWIPTNYRSDSILYWLVSESITLSLILLLGQTINAVIFVLRAYMALNLHGHTSVSYLQSRKAGAHGSVWNAFTLIACCTCISVFLFPYLRMSNYLFWQYNIIVNIFLFLCGTQENIRDYSRNQKISVLQQQTAMFSRPLKTAPECLYDRLSRPIPHPPPPPPSIDSRTWRFLRCRLWLLSWKRPKWALEVAFWEGPSQSNLS